MMDGRGVWHQGGDLLVLGAFGCALVPDSLAAFAGAERWAKKTGRLKRQG